MDINRINYCTKCKQELDEFKISIRLSVNVLRKKSSDAWENLGNMNVNSNEVLCKDCFDKFADVLSNGMRD